MFVLVAGLMDKLGNSDISNLKPSSYSFMRGTEPINVFSRRSRYIFTVPPTLLVNGLITGASMYLFQKWT